MFSGWHDIHKRPDTRFERSVVDTHQKDWELCELLKIYDEVAPRRVLEVGSYLGGTLMQFIQHAPEDATFVNIENFYMLTDAYRAALPKRWQEWLKGNQELYTLTSDSHDPETLAEVLRLLDQMIDFLFIDADHSYEAVRQDFDMYAPYVRTGGVIALHDIKQQDARPNYGVWKLWQEIQAAGYITQELRVIGDGMGIGVIYV